MINSNLNLGRPLRFSGEIPSDTQCPICLEPVENPAFGHQKSDKEPQEIIHLTHKTCLNAWADQTKPQSDKQEWVYRCPIGCGKKYYKRESHSAKFLRGILLGITSAGFTTHLMHQFSPKHGRKDDALILLFSVVTNYIVELRDLSNRPEVPKVAASLIGVAGASIIGLATMCGIMPSTTELHAMTILGSGILSGMLYAPPN